MQIRDVWVFYWSDISTKVVCSEFYFTLEARFICFLKMKLALYWSNGHFISYFCWFYLCQCTCGFGQTDHNSFLFHWVCWINRWFLFVCLYNQHSENGLNLRVWLMSEVSNLLVAVNFCLGTSFIWWRLKLIELNIWHSLGKFMVLNYEAVLLYAARWLSK